MEVSEFFRELEHTEVPWGERSIWVPLFYYDASRLDAAFLAPVKKLRALLPSARLHPYHVTPKQGLLTISAMEFRETDVGPYNEVSISIPCTLDRVTPLFTGSLRKAPAEPNVYIHRLPVSTEIAQDAGIEFAAYPKFLASIEFVRDGEWITCRLAEDGSHILSLTGLRLETELAPRTRVHFFTTRNGYLLRSTAVMSERQLKRSRDASHLKLELGNHVIADELREIGMGKMVAYQYTPQFQTILSPALESFKK